MLTKKIRGIIEWHFKNYKADFALYNDRVDEIINSGLTANYSGIGGSGGVNNPTEAKGLKLYELDTERTWAAVVRNTFITFWNKPEGKIMNALYIQGKPKSEILCNGLWETQFYRWRETWLSCAYEWAKKFGLL